jgi:hypothetical protein
VEEAVTAKELTYALNGKWAAGKGRANCPHHGGDSFSLAIRDGATFPVVTCFYGCERRDVMRTIEGLGIDLTGKGTRYVDRALQNLPRPKPKPEPTLDCVPMLLRWYNATTHAQRQALATKLGVSPLALLALGASWAPEHNAWAFPMKDAEGRIIGIRLRRENGFKFAVEGSHGGLIYEREIPHKDKVWICEGPTDTAAAMSLGLPAIGRPSCNACEDMTLALLKRIQAKRAVLVTDNDTPGIAGAEKLQARMPIPSLVWIPPAKDIRAFVQAGGTAEMIHALTDAMTWRFPQ